MTEVIETPHWERLDALAQAGDAKGLESYVETIGPSETFRALLRLGPEARERVLTTLSPEGAADLIEEIPEEHAADLIEDLEAKDAASIVSDGRGSSGRRTFARGMAEAVGSTSAVATSPTFAACSRMSPSCAFRRSFSSALSSRRARRATCSMSISTGMGPSVVAAGRGADACHSSGTVGPASSSIGTSSISSAWSAWAST